MAALMYGESLIPTMATIFGTSFLLALSGAMMPGPLLTATVGESVRRGFIAGPLLIAGHGILEAVLIIALMLGLAPLVTTDAVFITVSLVGGVILLWMAWGMFRSLPRLSLSLQAEEYQGGNPVLGGILLSLANPYWVVWWATIGLGYILQCRAFGFWGVAVFFAGHIAADLAWYAAVSAAVSKGRRFMNDRVYRLLIGACAAFLMVFACWFFYSGLDRAAA